MGLIKEALQHLVEEALQRAARSGDLVCAEFPPVEIEVPKNKAHGDFATAVALSMARSEKKAPRLIAEKIIAHALAILSAPSTTTPLRVERIELAGPGFINFFLHPAWLQDQVRVIRQADTAFGTSDIGGGERVQVEFVSANPTGPLNIVNARAAAVGDTLARLLAATGFAVEREFYVNDAGNQVLKLGRSLEARLRQAAGEDCPFPADGYPGAYLQDVARALWAAGVAGELLALPEEERIEALAQVATERIVAEQRALLERYGVHFDQWYHERRLRAEKAPEAVLALLQERGTTYQAEGAIWFASTRFGDDKDRVLVKSDGSYTYLLPDIAYHYSKLQRGFTKLLDLLGPDHHGYIARLQAAVTALGYPPDTLEVLIVQMVRLLRGGEQVRMSKRAGEFVTMAELLDEVGTDAARFFFLQRACESHLDFDLDLAKVQGNENPVFYVQYAHARIASILRQAKELGYNLSDDVPTASLQHPAELALLRRMADLPDEVASAALAREPHRLTYYAQDLAALFHAFYTECRVLGEEAELSQARLALTDAARIVLRNTLTLLGVTAPERM